jgi:sporulation protein YlmC with PRC-barrel domain
MESQTDTMSRNKSVETDETHDLIASDKVEGTAVYNRDDEKLGTIKNFMVGKRSGQVEYAVLSSGGLFGMGERNYPLPWNKLDYDTQKGGYMVNIDKETLKSGPSFDKGREPEFNRDYNQSIGRHYGTL